MNLTKLKACISKYKDFLQSKENKKYLYQWETLHFFQENWDTEAMDLSEMYDTALDNQTTRRQWVGDDFYPKEMMLKFIQTEPEYVRLAFRDLFNDNKSAAGRVDRFIFYCDELLKIYKEKNPVSNENNHYHTPEMVMFYLANRFPDKYSLYDSKAFHRFLGIVEAKNIPISHDLERYLKVCKTINTFLQRDEEIQALHEARLDENTHYTQGDLFILNEMMMVNS